MTVEKKAFRAPTTGDPREVELAFQRLDSKIGQTVDTLDAALTSKSEEIDEAIASIEDVTAQIDANTADIASLTITVGSHTTTISSHTSSISSLTSSVAAKVPKTAVGSVSGLNGEQILGNQGLGSTLVTYDGFDTFIKPDLNTIFSAINDDIETLAAKIDAMAAIITG